MRSTPPLSSQSLENEGYFGAIYAQLRLRCAHTLAKTPLSWPFFDSYEWPIRRELLAVLHAPPIGGQFGQGEVFWINAALRCTAEAGHTIPNTSAKADVHHKLRGASRHQTYNSFPQGLHTPRWFLKTYACDVVLIIRRVAGSIFVPKQMSCKLGAKFLQILQTSSQPNAALIHECHAWELRVRTRPARFCACALILPRCLRLDFS
jgi:hypothetical protein